MNHGQNIPSTLIMLPWKGMRGLAFDGQDGGGNPPNPNPPAPKDPEFSPEQQKFIETKFNEAFGKGYKKAETAAKAAADALQAQVDELKKQAADRGNGGDPKDKSKTYTQEDVQKMVNEGLKPLQDELKTSQARVAALLNNERSSAVIAAAATAKAVDPKEIDLLFGKYVTHDDTGKLVVVDDEGKPRLNSKLEPMSVDDAVKSYIDSKPHLKQGSGNPGAGSNSNNQPGAGGKKNGGLDVLVDFFASNGGL